MNKHAQALGRLGGAAGKGKAKARSTEQAREAAQARWRKHRKTKKRAERPSDPSSVTATGERKPMQALKAKKSRKASAEGNGGSRSLERVVRVRSWHALKKSEQEEILRSKMTVGTFMERFRQPKWCNHPEALAGIMGCWSLMTPGSIRNFDSCKGCECRARKARAHSNGPGEPLSPATQD